MTSFANKSITCIELWENLGARFLETHKSYSVLVLALRNCKKLLLHWKRLWCWEGLGEGGEGDNRGWDGWMASPTQWTWVWVNSGSWWWTRRPGVLQFMGSQRVGHDWVTEVKWRGCYLLSSFLNLLGCTALSCGLQDLVLWLGVKPGPPCTLKCRVLTTGPDRKSVV